MTRQSVPLSEWTGCVPHPWPTTGGPIRGAPSTERVVQDRATVPMHVVIAQELQVLGSHGMPAHDYPRLLADIAAGRLDPGRFLTRTIGLDEAPQALAAMSGATAPGVTVIRPGAGR